MIKYLMLLAAMMLMVACGGDETVKQPDIEYTSDGWAIYAGLEWSPKSATTMTWADANAYCQNLGGKLPSIDELRKIVTNCPTTVYDGTCQVSDPDCLSSSTCWSEDKCRCDDKSKTYSALGEEDKYAWLWSSSSLVDTNTYAWSVFFLNGYVNLFSKSSTLSARCVR